MSPFQFEIRNEDGGRSFIRVLNTFEHHYTKEVMRSVRIDSLAPYGVNGVSDYKVINEDEFNELLKRRITNDPD